MAKVHELGRGVVELRKWRMAVCCALGYGDEEFYPDHEGVAADIRSIKERNDALAERCRKLEAELVVAQLNSVEHEKRRTGEAAFVASMIEALVGVHKGSGLHALTGATEGIIEYLREAKHG
jgi:hypothetical protein